MTEKQAIEILENNERDCAYSRKEVEEACEMAVRAIELQMSLFGILNE